MLCLLVTLALGAAAKITNYAAIGDSYSSGVGAGDLISNSCWQFADSYPAQLNRSDLLPGDHRFQFLSCSGSRIFEPGAYFAENATIVEMYNNTSRRYNASQSEFPERRRRRTVDAYIDQIENASVATISMGGNDMGFFNLLNACAYHFYGPFSGTCEEELAIAETVVNSKQFTEGYNAALDLLLEKGDGPDYRVLVTGYSPFFDDALSPDCDEYSLSYWPGWWKVNLVVDVRRKMNALCEGLNDKIAQIVADRADERVVFVNWAHRFKEHRFCQPGKPPIDGDNTWFFDVNFRSYEIDDDDIDVDTCEEASMQSGDWGEQAACGIAITQKRFPVETRNGGRADIGVAGGRNPFAPSTSRLFHPTPRGYAAIVEEIRNVWPFETEPLR